MHAFYNSKTADASVDFINLVSALKGHDDYYIMDALSSNPSIAKRKTQESKTIPMLAAEFGCDVKLFSFILTKAKDVLADITPEGDTVYSILCKNKRNALIEVLPAIYHVANEQDPIGNKL